MAKALEQATLKATAQAILAPALSVMAPAVTPHTAPPQTYIPPRQQHPGISAPQQHAARYAEQPYGPRDMSRVRCYASGNFGHMARECNMTDRLPPYPYHPQYEEQGTPQGPPVTREQGRGRANNNENHRGGQAPPQRGRGRGNGQNRGGWRQGNANMQGVSAGPVPDGYDEWSYHYGDTY